MSGMTAEPVVKLCPNCGAPWDLGEGGTCRWCQAFIEVGPQRDRAASHVVSSVSSQTSLVPPEVDDCSSCSPFIYLILSVLGPILSSEPAVQAYVGAQPGLLPQIRALTAAVSEAGVRARDAGALKSDIDNRLSLYTSEQIWTFDLAADVIAVLSVLDAMSASVRATVGGHLRSLDQEVHSHAWKKEVKKAGEGPDAFRDLRAAVPHHKPKPAY
jgi:hypothetical protein